MNVGELTYVLTRTVDSYLCSDPRGYAEMAEGIAALECSKLELYRRIVAPYEDGKMRANGDVYHDIPGQWSGGLAAAP